MVRKYMVCLFHVNYYSFRSLFKCSIMFRDSYSALARLNARLRPKTFLDNNFAPPRDINVRRARAWCHPDGTSEVEAKKNRRTGTRYTVTSTTAFVALTALTTQLHLQGAFPMEARQRPARSYDLSLLPANLPPSLKRRSASITASHNDPVTERVSEVRTSG